MFSFADQASRHIGRMIGFSNFVGPTYVDESEGVSGSTGHASRQMEWRFTAECFACTMLVQRREVDSASWGVVLFPGDYHSVTPCHSFTTRYRRRSMTPIKGLVTHYIMMYALLPMHWDHGRCVYSLSSCTSLEMDPHWGLSCRAGGGEGMS